MKGFIVFIGVILVVVCVIITIGNPGAKIFGVSAVLVGMLGMMLMKK